LNAFAEELYGPALGRGSPGTIRALINHLDDLLPGIRLKERLISLDNITHQKIADALSVDGLSSLRQRNVTQVVFHLKGLLNASVLNVFRMSDIRCLALTTSMIDEDGLNLLGPELLTGILF
jgi:hypothetical protein